MKTLTSYINEDFKISKTTKLNIQKPKTCAELRDIVNQRYAENGNVIDLRDVDVSEIENFTYPNPLQITGAKTRNKGLFEGLEYVIEININGWKTEQAKGFDYMFCDCINLRRIIGIENIKTDSVERLRHMFESCQELRSLDLSKWNVSRVETMHSMFRSCIHLKTLDLSTWKYSKNLESISRMFQDCRELETVKGIKELNKQFVSVYYQDDVYKGCVNLKDRNVIA